MIYLDNNATTRVSDHVVQAMIPYFREKFLNPGSLAGELEGIDQVIEEAKLQLANLTGCSPCEYFLTSGATESNNWVLRSIAKHFLSTEGVFNLVISPIEHPSVLQTAQDLAQDPRVNLEIVAVDAQGQVNTESLKKVIKKSHLVSIIWANNESGVIQSIAELSQLVKNMAPGCLFHTDATQAVGKIPVNIHSELAGVDLLSLSAHKFHGPKGIGALYIRQGVTLAPFITGGGQQSGMRSGTGNPALAAGFAAALDLLSDKVISEQIAETSILRDHFESELLKCLPGITILSKEADRLANTSLIVFPKIEGEMAVSQLYQAGFIISTGAACSSGSDTPSYVATAMGVTYQQARNAVRITLSKETTREEILLLLSAIKNLW